MLVVGPLRERSAQNGCVDVEGHGALVGAIDAALDAVEA